MVSEEFETLSGFVVDGDVSRKPVSRTSAETEEMLKSTDRIGCIPRGLVRTLYRATLMKDGDLLNFHDNGSCRIAQYAYRNQRFNVSGDGATSIFCVG